MISGKTYQYLPSVKRCLSDDQKPCFLSKTFAAPWNSRQVQQFWMLRSSSRCSLHCRSAGCAALRTARDKSWDVGHMNHQPVMGVIPMAACLWSPCFVSSPHVTSQSVRHGVVTRVVHPVCNLWVPLQVGCFEWSITTNLGKHINFEQSHTENIRTPLSQLC